LLLHFTCLDEALKSIDTVLGLTIKKNEEDVEQHGFARNRFWIVDPDPLPFLSITSIFYNIFNYVECYHVIAYKAFGVCYLCAMVTVFFFFFICGTGSREG
jgi:hypothetical protein